MGNSMADLILAVHLAWALWMTSGVFLALAGFIRPRLWRWSLFRTLHLAGIVATATVPLWAGGVCPMTRWESAFQGTRGAPEPFLIIWLRRILFWEVDPMWLSLLTITAAGVTVVVYALHPPWRSDGESGCRRKSRCGEV
jgi:hypothetical protein